MRGNQEILVGIHSTQFSLNVWPMAAAGIQLMMNWPGRLTATAKEVNIVQLGTSNGEGACPVNLVIEVGSHKAAYILSFLGPSAELGIFHY